MEVVGDVSHDRRLSRLACGELRGIRRDDEEDDVGDNRRDQEEEEGPEETTDDEVTHGSESYCCSGWFVEIKSRFWRGARERPSRFLPDPFLADREGLED